MFTRLFFGLLFALLVPLPVFAQSAVQIQLSSKTAVQLDQRVVVEVEVSDEHGEPAKGSELQLTFEPGNAVAEEQLLNCSNPDEYDQCSVNARGVEGVFEVSFVLLDAPVILEAEVAGVRESLQLAPEGYFDKNVQNIQKDNNQFVVQPDRIQAGPFPSFWFLAFPFVLLCSVVFFFCRETLS